MKIIVIGSGWSGCAVQFKQPLFIRTFFQKHNSSLVLSWSLSILICFFMILFITIILPILK
ncbi:hypothetical protein [Clostridium coskatii]|uniref:Uncharacterized protein n=1 Tax=Clostridium coskatii TaxID=1705578 RepID=A0A166TTA3_9CLOT|nr:hypothetical protein [Clostridium coskatii]OAA94063.1 hypothetical protein WX73_03633 [Clostridium coskatii]OBR96625.1 hypothetical protein CLCOS_07870 [Clostridium coskatii]